MSRDREWLAARQATLLAALVADGPTPPGFDPARLAVEAAGLAAKRRRVLAARIPDDVADALGAELDDRLTAWIATHPHHVGTSTHDVAAAFTLAQRRDGALPGRLRWPRRRRERRAGQ